jgi:putative thiamine transport system substrate-binding protein
VLVTLAPDKAALARSPDDAAFAAASRPVFDYLDRLHPFLWRKARTFPQNVSALRTAFADGELDLGLTFNPGDAAASIARSEIPTTVRTYGLDGGTIGNAHFVAIPLNASAKAAALVVADFLLSPQAQARKADQAVWGDPTVLALSMLGPAERTLFEGSQGGTVSGPGVPALPEPHPDWSGRLEAEWARRYGVAP